MNSEESTMEGTTVISSSSTRWQKPGTSAESGFKVYGQDYDDVGQDEDYLTSTAWTETSQSDFVITHIVLPAVLVPLCAALLIVLGRLLISKRRRAKKKEQQQQQRRRNDGGPSGDKMMGITYTESVVFLAPENPLQQLQIQQAKANRSGVVDDSRTIAMDEQALLRQPVQTQSLPPALGYQLYQEMELSKNKMNFN